GANQRRHARRGTTITASCSRPASSWRPRSAGQLAWRVYARSITGGPSLRRLAQPPRSFEPNACRPTQVQMPQWMHLPGTVDQLIYPPSSIERKGSRAWNLTVPFRIAASWRWLCSPHRLGDFWNKPDSRSGDYLDFTSETVHPVGDETIAGSGWHDS